MGDLTGFAKRMKEAREQAGLKQKELAEKIGVSAQTISAYEKTGKLPTLDKAAQIANVLGVSLDWLCGNPDGRRELLLGDIALIVRELAFSEFAYVGDDLHDSRNHNTGTGIIFHDDAISSFLSDDMKMRSLLRGGTFDQKFYDRWLEDRIRSLNDIK